MSNFDYTYLENWSIQDLQLLVANRVSMQYANSLDREQLLSTVKTLLKLEDGTHRQKIYLHA